MNLSYKQQHYYTDFSASYYSSEAFSDLEDTPSLVTLKPTLNCNANCLHCSPRSKHFHGEKVLDINSYKILLGTLKELGTRVVCVSGGEPFLYKDLDQLIYTISHYGMIATLNTNGYLLTKERVRQLADNGLMCVNLSLDSPHNGVHDNLRGLPGLFTRVMENLANIQNDLTDFILNIRMVLSRHNYLDIPSMLSLAMEVNADMLSIDMVEADSKNQEFLLNEEQIVYFNENEKEKIISAINNLSIDPELKNLNNKQVNDIYNLRFNSAENYASGLYWPDNRIKEKCTIPSSFMIIEGGGSVLQCNAVEYHREYICGSVNDTSIENIWISDKRQSFIKHKADMCIECPMNMSFMLLLKQRNISRSIK